MVSELERMQKDYYGMINHGRTEDNLCFDRDSNRTPPAYNLKELSLEPKFSAKYCHVGLEVLTPVVMKSSIFWDIASWSPVKVNRRFGGSTCYLLYAGFLFGLMFDPEDRGDMFLRNAY
jgi:hypothetical protein